MKKSGYLKYTEVSSKSQANIYWKRWKSIESIKKEGNEEGYKTNFTLTILQPTPAYKPVIFLTISNTTGKVRIPFSNISSILKLVDTVNRFIGINGLEAGIALSKVKAIWEAWNNQTLEMAKEKAKEIKEIPL